MSEPEKDERRPARNTVATTSTTTSSESSTGIGEVARPRLVILGHVYRPRQRLRRGRVPTLSIEIPYEGSLTASIRDATDERDAASLRLWLETDPELRELCRIARAIRDRRAA